MMIMKYRHTLLIFNLLLLSLCNCAGLRWNGKPDQSPPRDEINPPTPLKETSPSLSEETEVSLAIYPLKMGSTWIYNYLAYDQQSEVVWKVFDEVVDVSIWEGYYLAELERSIVLIEGHPGGRFISGPKPGRFWFVVDGGNLYRFNEILSSDLSGAWLDLILPFPQDSQGWYPHPDQRAHLQMATTGFRSASAPFSKVLPQGGIYTCYNVATRYQDGTAEGTFCEGVGFVYQEFNLFNRAFGYRIELEDFSTH